MSPSDQRAWDLKADNLRRAWKHYEARDIILGSLPFRLMVELTENCNFRCTMCEQSWNPRYQKYEPSFNMTMELFDRVSTQLFPTALNVDLRGFGETTLLPYWPELVESLDRFPLIEWNLVSNLSLRRDDVWDKMMKHNFVIGGSIDAASAPIFEAIRRGSDFARIRHNLEVLRDARARHQAGYVYFISVIQRSNVDEMRGIVELAAEMGVHEVQFHIVRGSSGIDLGGSMLLNGQVQGAARAAIDAALALGVAATFNAPVFTRRIDPALVARAAQLPERAVAPSLFHGAPGSATVAHLQDKLVDSYRVKIHKNCFKPFSYATLTSRGELGTCNCMQPNIPVMGDFSVEGIESIWNGPVYRQFRREIFAQQPTDPRCQWCFENRLTD